MDDPKPQFSHLARGLAELGLAYIHVVESRISGAETIDAWNDAGAVILAGGFHRRDGRGNAEVVPGTQNRRRVREALPRQSRPAFPHRAGNRFQQVRPVHLLYAKAHCRIC